jgi:primosomal protein N' (replication factor Y)
MERKTLFVDAIVPLSVPNLYTYRVPYELNDFVQPGVRIIVPFGRNKLHTAVIRTVHENIPTYTTKLLDYILDDIPIVTEVQLRLWEWIATYYMCNIGDVMTAALPSSFKLASETKILLNENFQEDESTNLTDNEYIIKDALSLRGTLDLAEIAQIIDRKTVYPIVKRLIDKGVIVVEEEIKAVYRPKKEKYVTLNDSITAEAQLEGIFDGLKRAVKQQELLLQYLQLSNHFGNRVEVKKADLIEKSGLSSAIVKSLYDKNILNEYQVEIGRLKNYDGERQEIKQLTEDQNVALDQIQASFLEKPICLLHGITGSGKTEVYVELMNRYIAKGQTVLYLLPEIALTTQIITRLKKYYGDRIGVYHSKFSPHERVEIWNAVLNDKLHQYDVILGARSAVFLPFKKLGLIIVDEEHETSFKQHDPAPRYNARDTSVILARAFKSDVLLGSATPAIETMWNAKEGNFGLVEMKKRFGGVQLPEIQCADIAKAKRKKEMFGIFSAFLLETMKDALKKGEQIILFQNRRGYAPKWMCEDCGWIPMCTQCDVSLTYHKYTQLLSCHYCGYTLRPPSKCGACGSSDIKMVGFGTEKIEEELSVHLGKEVVIQRMDLDTTRSKHAYQNIISDFENRKIDILVGTQMVTKGLDFDNVSLVGVLNADDMLFYPDYRAFERAYQLMTQVSGRAGRNKKRGKVIIQTHTPDHWIIQKVMQNDYEGMYTQELYERSNFQYPPYYRIIRLTVRHRDKHVVDDASKEFTKALKVKLGNRVLGPEYGAIPRIKNVYNKQVTIKYERNASAKQVKEYILTKIAELRQVNSLYKSVRVKIDVDPV